MTQIEALPTSLHRLRPLRVLVVGSDRRFLRVTSFLLGRKGYVVVQAAPLEAAAAAARHHADVVVLEAGGSKANAARNIAALGALPAAPGVVIITEGAASESWANFETVPKWTSLGALADRIETAALKRPSPILQEAVPAESEAIGLPSAEDASGGRTRFITVAAVALLSILAAMRYGLQLDTVVAVFLVVVLVLVSRTDLERGAIPNRIVILPWLTVLVANTALHPHHWAEWLLASVGAASVFFILARLYPGSLAMGDVKVVLLLGAALGWQVVPALLIGTAGAAVLSLLILLRRGLSARQEMIPLAPFLAAGAVVDLLLL